MRLKDLFFPAGPRQLAEAGVLSMNCRNSRFILQSNPRALYPRVDDKLQTKAICRSAGVPVPETYGVLRLYGDLRRLQELVASRPDFVIKPACGAEGRGIAVVLEHDGQIFQTAGRETLSLAGLRYHASSILTGLFSLGGHPDAAIIEQRIVRHPAFEAIAVRGTPDVRVIVYRGIPVMAMVRLPTMASKGRANLHQGAIGAGVDLLTGRTIGGVCRNEFIVEHPDTHVDIRDFQIPHWEAIRTAAMRLADALELGYVGIDLLVDADHGPLVLEANARPGLAIQIANQQGLRHRLEFIEDRVENNLPFDVRLRIVEEMLARTRSGRH